LPGEREFVAMSVALYWSNEKVCSSNLTNNQRIVISKTNLIIMEYFFEIIYLNAVELKKTFNPSTVKRRSP
jgi:hypothetical protein